MDLHEPLRKRLKHADRLVAAAKQRGVAAHALRRFADGASVGLRAEPAQRSAPLDERLARKLERRRSRRNRYAPQRRRSLGRVPEERIRLFADACPEAFALRGVDELASDFFPRGGYRGSRAREAHAELAPGPGARADRQGPAAPLV